MKATSEFKPFNRDRSIEELRYNVIQWLEEFEFVDFEIRFLKGLVKTFPFKNIIPNLFEQIQLFTQDLVELNNQKNTLVENIEKHHKQLDSMTECNELSCDHYFLLQHEHLTEDVHNYSSRFRELKVKIYNYLLTINS